jgi:signal transduction histidine kinase
VPIPLPPDQPSLAVAPAAWFRRPRWLMPRPGLRDWLTQGPDGLALLRMRRGGRLTVARINPRAATLLHVAAAAARGRCLAAIWTAPHAQMVERRARACLDRGATAELDIDAPALRLRLMPLDRDSVLLCITEIGERARQEEARGHAQALEAVGRVTAGVAHDFNNLLQAQFGSLELLLEGLVEHPEQRELAQTAMRIARRAAELTHHLLGFSRKQVLQPCRVPVREFLGKLAGRLSGTLGPQVQVSVVVGVDAPAVRADPAKLATALMALAVNARDAMPGGGDLSIEVVSGEVVSGEVVPGNARHCAAPPGLAPGAYVAIVLADTGRGMPADVVARACEPFFTTKGLNGPGLGLSMALGFARQSGGDLTIASARGHGTRVALWLPADAAPPLALPASAASHPGTLPAGVAGRVLLVDDAPDARIAVGSFLEGAGYEVVQVGSGERAVALLAAGENFDALVTDYALPGLNGAELVLRALFLRPLLPMLIVTGQPDVAGFGILPRQVQVLRKPFRRDELVRTLAEALRARGFAPAME